MHWIQSRTIFLPRNYYIDSVLKINPQARSFLQKGFCVIDLELITLQLCECQGQYCLIWQIKIHSSIIIHMNAVHSIMVFFVFFYRQAFSYSSNNFQVTIIAVRNSFHLRGRVMTLVDVMRARQPWINWRDTLSKS